MKRLGDSRLLAWLCLASYLLGGMFASSGLVMCIEPDGRIALEAAHGLACEGCGESPDGGDAEPDASRRCGCVDIPIFAGRDEQSPQAGAKPIEARVPLLAAAPPPPFARPATRPSALAPAAPDPSASRPPPLLVHLRSVILVL